MLFSFTIRRTAHGLCTLSRSHYAPQCTCPPPPLPRIGVGNFHGNNTPLCGSQVVGRVAHSLGAQSYDCSRVSTRTSERGLVNSWALLILNDAAECLRCRVGRTRDAHFGKLPNHWTERTSPWESSRTRAVRAHFNRIPGLPKSG